jgi:hypothetical protein
MSVNIFLYKLLTAIHCHIINQKSSNPYAYQQRSATEVLLFIQVLVCQA